MASSDKKKKWEESRQEGGQLPKPIETLKNGDAPELEFLFPSPRPSLLDVRAYYSSPEALARHIKSLNKSLCWDRAAWDPGKNFYGTETMEEAIQYAEQGWKDGVTKVTKLSGKILAQNYMQKKPVQYGVAGTTPNIPRAIAGNPVNMRLPDLKKGSRRPVITLLNDMCVSWNNDEILLANRAAVVAALIDMIEGAGYSCEVVSFALSKYQGSSLVAVQVKNSNQPVDIPRLAFGLGHPAFFRRMIFAEWGSNVANSGVIGSGFGCVEVLNIDKILEKDHVYVIPSLQDAPRDCFKTEEAAATKGLQYIIHNLNAQKFPVFQDQEIIADIEQMKKAA